MIDNYDSFVYNLVQYLGELGPSRSCTATTRSPSTRSIALDPDAVLISPGPGRPEDAGLSQRRDPRTSPAGVPVLGVCLGHQCIGQVFGGEVVRAPQVMHGKTR